VEAAHQLVLEHERVREVQVYLDATLLADRIERDPGHDRVAALEVAQHLDVERLPRLLEVRPPLAHALDAVADGVEARE
jgi:hypothetical protein